MARRKTVNETHIRRLSEVDSFDAWATYKCVKCKKINHVRIGRELITPEYAFNNCMWICEHCGFIHAKDSDLPFENWDEEDLMADSMTTYRFWEGFFRSATENPEAYWKQCNVCGRILPFSSFSKHADWGPLERQMECRGCKGAINASLNPKRTKQQLHESSVRRRIAELFADSENEFIDINELFKRFDSKCFKTGAPLDINQKGTWHIDHILPSKYLYPLSVQNAALLSAEANSNKRDMWPSKFYTNNQLIELSRITGANLELISRKTPIINRKINVNKGVERYLQVREASDLPKRIAEIKKILEDYDLVENLSPENKKLLGY